MTLSLKCTCGVRLDIPETFAGQQITCPDCQHPIAVPRNDPALIKTSGLALTSLLLALVGAFTVVGTLLAVAFGILASIQIRRQPDVLAGKRYAMAGMVLGVVLTATTLFAYQSAERLGLRNLLGQAHWAGKLDYNVPKIIKRDEENFSIERPSDRWGILKKPPTKDEDHIIDELLLVNVDEDAHFLVLTEQIDAGNTLDQYLEKKRNEFCSGDLEKKIFDNKSGSRAGGEVRSTKRPPPIGSMNLAESLIDKKVGSQERTFIMRVVQNGNDEWVFLLLAGTRKGNFERVEAQLRKALDSFKVLNNRQ